MVKLGRILDNTRHAAKLRHNGHLAGKGGTERIDRLDLQPRGIGHQIPSHRGVPFENGSGKLASFSLMLVQVFCLPALRFVECLQDPLTHFGSGLSREGHSHYGFRSLHAAQQTEIPLH